MRIPMLTLMLIASTPVLAQQAPKADAPKATKAEVDQVVGMIKGDPNKMQSYCKIVKMQTDYQKAEEQKNEQKLKELDTQMDEASKPLGPQFEKVMSSELDDASAKSLDDLSASCKT